MVLPTTLLFPWLSAVAAAVAPPAWWRCLVGWPWTCLISSGISFSPSHWLLLLRNAAAYFLALLVDHHNYIIIISFHYNLQFQREHNHITPCTQSKMRQKAVVITFYYGNQCKTLSWNVTEGGKEEGRAPSVFMLGSTRINWLILTPYTCSDWEAPPSTYRKKWK